MRLERYNDFEKEEGTTFFFKIFKINYIIKK